MYFHITVVFYEFFYICIVVVTGINCSPCSYQDVLTTNQLLTTILFSIVLPPFKFDTVTVHSAAGWGIGGSVIAADCWVQSPFGQWAAATCAAPPSVIAGQYATSHCKLLLVMFTCSCKWQYINVDL